MEVLKQRMEDVCLEYDLNENPPMKTVESKQEYVDTILAKRRLEMQYQEDLQD
jgi:hypothetical protein